MSKLGKKKIDIPKEVNINFEGKNLLIKGPQGIQNITVDNNLFDIKLDEKDQNKTLTILPKSKVEQMKILWGMNRSIINNAIIGVSKGYEKVLEMNGVGYRASIKDNNLILQLGFSHDVNYEFPKEIKVSVEKQTIIRIKGFDKQKVGMVASEIKSLKRTEPYKGKGIKEKGEYILRKEGKKK